MQKYIKTPKHIYTEPKPESTLLLVVALAIPVFSLFTMLWLLSGHAKLECKDDPATCQEKTGDRYEVIYHPETGKAYAEFKY